MLLGSSSTSSIFSSLFASSRKNRLRSNAEFAKSSPSLHLPNDSPTDFEQAKHSHDLPPMPYSAGGAGPAMFHPHHSHASMPPMPEPPMSAPMAFHRTDETFSRIDYTPAPVERDRGSHRSKKSIASKPKSLARKLSTKAKLSRGADMSHASAPSINVNDKMRAFEEMVAAAEKAVGIAPGSSAEKSVKASTFSHTARRQSLSGDLSFDSAPPASTPPAVDSIPFPLDIPSTPVPDLPIRPAHHRRSSSTSIKSSRASIKSSRRAEREWRARVAALAYTSSPQSSVVQLRGPVPPKRTPAHKGTASRSVSPESDHLLTPAHSIGASGMPAKSIVSNYSFRTLGHYADLSPSMPRDAAAHPDELVARERKVSVPQAVMSSFYFDPTSSSRVSTRPSSFAASHLLGAVPVETASPLRHSSVAASAPVDVVPSPAKDRSARRLELPPFESFAFSPSTSHTPARTQSPALPESAIRPLSSKSPAKRASAPAQTVDAGLRLQVSIHKSKGVERYNTIPPRHPSSPAPATPVAPTHAVAVARGIKLNGTRVPTPSRSTKSSVPGTPLSPTTAFLLTAPIGSLSLGQTFDSPDQKPRVHPYTVQRVNFDDAPTPPTPATPSHAHRASTDRPNVPFPVQAHDDSFPRPASPAAFDPFSAPPRKRKDKDARAKVDSTDKSRRVLQVRKAQSMQPAAAVLGSTYDPKVARSDLERQGEKLRKMGVDLTPGMESGQRPPKSGLPRDRWLTQTAGAP